MHFHSFFLIAGLLLPGIFSLNEKTLPLVLPIGLSRQSLLLSAFLLVGNLRLDLASCVLSFLGMIITFTFILCLLIDGSLFNGHWSHVSGV